MSESDFKVGGQQVTIYSAPQAFLNLCQWQGASGQCTLSFSNAEQAAQIIRDMSGKTEGRFAAVGSQWAVDEKGADNKTASAHLFSPKQFSFAASDFPAKKILETMEAYAERLEGIVKAKIDDKTRNALVTLRVFKAAGNETLKVNYEAATSVLIKYGDAWFLINQNKWAQINNKPFPPTQMHAVPAGHGLHNVLHAFPAPDHH